MSLDLGRPEGNCCMVALISTHTVTGLIVLLKRKFNDDLVRVKNSEGYIKPKPLVLYTFMFKIN